MLEDYDDFVEQSGSPRHAINCMLSAYHMAEWIWGDWLQTDYATWRALGIRDRESFLGWVDKSQIWFKITQAVANGSKHFVSKLANTKSSPSYVEDGYVEDGYQKRRKRFADPLVRGMTGACKDCLGSTRWRYDFRRQNGRPIGRLEGEPRQSA